MKLPRLVLAGIGAPALPIAGLGLPIVVYLPPFFANTIGIPLVTVGIIFMLARFWDVFTDVLFGIVADRTRPPLGRRKFWMLLSLPILMASVWLLFNPPEGAGPLFLSIWLAIMYVGWTMATISVISWSAELSTDYDERTRVQAWYMGFLMVGLIAVLVVPAIIEQVGGGDNFAKMRGISLFIIVLLPICFGFALWKVPEARVHEDTSEDWAKVLVKMWKSKPLLLILLCDLIIGLASGIAGSLYLFVAVDALNLGKGASLLLLFYFFTGCLAVPLWAWMAKRLEKHRALAGASVYAGFAALLFLAVPKDSMILMLIVTVLNGITYASARFLLKAMMADVTDADRMESGRMQSGVYFSLLTLTEKIGLALAVGIPYAILPAMGFTAGGPNSPAALDGLLMIFAGAPAVLHLIAAVVLWRFPLGRLRQQELREKLAAKFGT
jgi:GPH family glycoside/pentoside/hexuronide:cation symporter